MGHVAVRNAIRVKAPAEAVWRVLSDFDGFPKWNPMLIRMRGQPIQGSGLVFTVQLANGWKLPLWGKVSQSSPPTEMRWRVGVPGLLRGEHYITVERKGTGCVVTHGEDFRGLLCAPLRGLLESLGGPMYARMNEALKVRAERSAVGAARAAAKTK